MKRIAVVGVPPGAKALDSAAVELMTRADLVVGAARHLDLAGPLTARKMAVEGRVSEAVDLCAADASLKAVFLASGDPGFFGVGALLIKKLGAGEVTLHPAVTSLQAAFALIGEPWSEARFCSTHGRSLDTLLPLLGAQRIGILTDGDNGPAKIARLLVDSGWEDLEMVVCSDIGMEAEKVERAKAADFTAWSGSPMNVVLLIDRAPAERPLGPGLPDELFAHPRGRITKHFVRAAALSSLALPRSGVLWDIGAGSGSVGIEAALLCPGLKVFAIEKDAEALDHIAENRRKFRVASLSVVAGAAPGALKGLPAPDRVFIGGSGGNMGEILDTAWGSMNPGGVIVVSTVLAETFQETLAWAKANDRAAEWAEVMVSRSKQTGSGTRLAAQDPVTLIRIEKSVKS